MQRLRLSGASLLKTKWSRFSFHARSFSTGHPPVVPVDEEFRAHLDFKGFKANHEVLKHVVETRNMTADVDKVITLYEQFTELTQQINEKRKERNQLSRSRDTPIEQRREIGRQLKQDIADLEAQKAACDSQLQAEGLRIPNYNHPDTPVGTEDRAELVRKGNELPSFTFEPKEHIELGENLGMWDKQATSSLTGSRFVSFKNDAASLELALINWASLRLREKGFDFFLPPDLAHISVVHGCGFQPRGEGSQVYLVQDSDLCLVGTGEIPLAGMHANTLLDPKALPLRYGAFTHCFRKEVGSRGKKTRGIYRLHQFSKVEMFIFCQEEDSEEMFKELVNVQESFVKDLGLHYRILNMPTQELGASAYQKYDIEVWMPGRGGYGEVCSASNCTDYQSRRLGIRYRTGPQSTQFVHTLNATALAVPRIILSILETFQQEDGSVVVPEVLRPFLGNRERFIPSQPSN